MDDLWTYPTIAKFGLWTTRPSVLVSYPESTEHEGGMDRDQSLIVFKTLVDLLMTPNVNEMTVANTVTTLSRISSPDDWSLYRSILTKEKSLYIKDFHRLHPDLGFIKLNFNQQAVDDEMLIHHDVTQDMERVHICVAPHGYEVFDQELQRTYEFGWLEALDPLRKTVSRGRLLHLIGYMKDDIIRVIDIEMSAEALRRRRRVEELCFDVLPPWSNIAASDAILGASVNNSVWKTPLDADVGDGWF